MRQETRSSARPCSSATSYTPVDSGSRAGQSDAAALLRTYHRQVEEWFVEFAQARSRQRQRERALTVALTAQREAAAAAGQPNPVLTG
jgi:hypothetical protein